MRMPQIIAHTPRHLPTSVVGVTSPKPVVVVVASTNQKASGIEPNGETSRPTPDGVGRVVRVAKC